MYLEGNILSLIMEFKEGIQLSVLTHADLQR